MVPLHYFFSSLCLCASVIQLRPPAPRTCGSSATLRFTRSSLWTGSKAVELGLADELGDLDRAIEIAAEMAGVPARSAPVRARRAFLSRLADRFATGLVGSVADRIEAELWRRDLRY